ncbi:MAG TPA: MFS transporter [Bacteroidota bacterium]|nr:MFS transporter [Bacteroidota bacterium]
MTFRERLTKGFHRVFWVANVMELFERLAYYGQATILTIYLTNHLGMSVIDAGKLSSVFGGLLYFLPIFAGTLADKFGYRRAFMAAFSLLAVGYFLIGSTGMHAFNGVYAGMSVFWVLVPIVMITAFGGSFIKPSVLGTVAVTSKPDTKSLGFALYYMIVNIGAFLGPVIANIVRKNAGIEYVYLVSAASCALMFLVNLFFYRNVPDPEVKVVESMGKKFLNMFIVLANMRFILFLLIFAFYWVMFWAGLYIIIPLYVTDYIDKNANFEIILATGAATIILFQLLVNSLTKGLPTKTAIVIGLGVSSLSWLIIAVQPTIPSIVVALVVWSIGEMIQAPRYYEYISDIAPPGQQALFQGYAFLPIAIAWFTGGMFGGWLYTVARDSGAPVIVWFTLFGIGVAATVFMVLYNTFAAARTIPGVEGK